MRKMSQARPPDFTRDTGDTTLSPFQDIAMNIRMHRRKARILCLLLASTSQPLWAHVGPHPSVHDTVAGVVERMKRTLSTNDLANLTVPKVEQFLTSQEREVLSTEHISFRVNVPVRVSVLRDVSLKDEPFWLRARGFRTNSVTVKDGKAVFDVWEKDFEAGRVGLGIHSLSGGGNHYLVLLAPKQPGEKVVVSELYPGQLRAAEFRAGADAWSLEAYRSYPMGEVDNALLDLYRLYEPDSGFWSGYLERVAGGSLRRLVEDAREAAKEAKRTKRDPETILRDRLAAAGG